MGIEDIVFQERGIEHEDYRRELLVEYNGDKPFEDEQSKYAIMKQAEVLGGHYHDYREFFYMVAGVAHFELCDIDTEERAEFTLGTGDSLLIPARIAHRAMVEGGAILHGLTEDKYISPKHNDHPYDF